MFNTRNKSGISAHPCIILYLNYNLTGLNYVISDCYQSIMLSVIVKVADRSVLFYIIIKLSVIAKPPNP
jgi:hypothetical protein